MKSSSPTSRRGMSSSRKTAEVVEQLLEQSVVPFDEDLLERARTQWHFGDWESLASIDRNILQHHPDRAKLSLLSAAGWLQMGNVAEARQLIQLAQDWGVNGDLIAKVLVAGVHNSLARASILGNQQQRAMLHFEVAISIGLPGSDIRLIAPARADEQLRQLGGTHRISAKEERPSNRFGGSSGEPQLLDSRNSKLSERYETFSSSDYWEDRYKKGGTSGFGSYGKLAAFKARVLNKFIAEERIQTVIDLGCGDGNQLSLIKVDNYIGIDVSSTIVEKCKTKFMNDNSKTFHSYDQFKNNPVSADLALSLDVLFHLVEDSVFEDYVTTLFGAAEKYCIIYACDEKWQETDASHVRRRKFTEWIERHVPTWRLSQVTYNKYPHDGSRNPKETSFSNFYFFERLSQ